MAATRGAPWLQVTRGSPERLRTRRQPVGIRRQMGRDRGYPAVVAGNHVAVLAAPTRRPPSTLPYPQLAVSGSVTCLLARRGSGAIIGLGGAGRSHTRRR